MWMHMPATNSYISLISVYRLNACGCLTVKEHSIFGLRWKWWGVAMCGLNLSVLHDSIWIRYLGLQLKLELILKSQNIPDSKSMRDSEHSCETHKGKRNRKDKKENNKFFEDVNQLRIVDDNKLDPYVNRFSFTLITHRHTHTPPPTRW